MNNMMKVLVAAVFVGIAAAQIEHPLLNCQDQMPIVQIGSSTVFPIAQQHSVRYANPNVSPLALSTGSTLGFSNFFGGGSDISTASRALRASDYERADCNPAFVSADGIASETCQGRLPVGVRVGTDKLAIIVNTQNTWVPDSGLTSAQVSQLFNVQSPPSWRDVFPQGVIDEPLLAVPDAQSGTRDFFEEATSLDLSGQPGFVDDVQILELVMANPEAIGVLPFSVASGATGDVRVLPIDGVNPLDDAATGYVFERPLFKYYDAAPGATNDQVLDFLCTLMDTSGQDIISVTGYTPLPEAERAAEFAALGCRSRIGVNRLTQLTGVMQRASFCRDAVKLSAIGSSTVFPVSEEAARVYPNPIVNVIARSTGSTIGIRDLLAGAADVGAASRAIRQSDYDAFECPADGIVDGVAQRECQGVLPRGVNVGTDMLAVIVNPASTITDLSMADLEAIFVAQSRAASLFVPDRNSGTRGFFEEEVGAIDANGFVDDTDIVDNVANTPDGIGFLGAAFASDPRVKVVTINGVSPLDNDASYALARPLFMYFDASPDAFSKATNEFLCWMLASSGGQQVVQNVGYVTLPEADRAAQATQLECLEA